MELAEFGRSFAALIVVLLLIGGIAFLAKRFLPQFQINQALSKRRMKLLETMILDPRNRLTLVQCDDEQFLIGLGQNGPVLLKTVQTRSVEPPAAVGRQ